MSAWTMTEQRYLSIEQVAKRLGYHPNTIKTWIRDGRLPASRPGGRQVRIALSDLNEFLEKNKIQVKKKEQEPEACI